ncbi:MULTISPECIES: hypothetical protein [unclassified Nitratiruptor]|uniref:hypothetical protein n=1 Tax=unclassified Nitratiruptor TaxID=2624044 RepID=UPI001915D657|nr:MULTISPECIES: hypothetical protein [unclassified Nitratiruptor]BCD59814.1 hypothetical protein NitYY0810_C0571 [Nitratiruptor sp. YY08-10]BCD63738.1 hypothetical protein NitYY0814_C0571 [Nitratiruptor sp. YY08-14]
MKKVVLVLLVLLVVVGGGIYWLLFTKSGNRFLQPKVENYLNQKLPVQVVLQKFQIAPMDIVVQIGKSSIIAKGNVNPFQRSFDIKYKIKIVDLAALQPLHHQKIRGALNTSGTVQGNIDNFMIKGKSDIAKSATNYQITIKELEPKALQAVIQHADLAKLQYMVYQPVRTYGKLTSDIKLESLESDNLKGVIVSHISQGRVNEQAIEKEFGIKNAKIVYSIDQKSVLQGQTIVSDILFDSNIATAKMDSIIYNVKEDSLTIPYIVNIPNLSKLYFVTNQKMRGKIKVTGKVQKAKDFIVTAHSKTLGGRVDAVLKNTKLDVKLKNIQVTALTYMLYYPKVFDSVMEADVHYDIAAQKGKLLAQAYDGRILPNQMTFLLQQIAKFDITREVYKVTTIKSDINKKRIISNLDMQSRLTHISSKNALVDLEKEFVDAKLRVEIKKKPVFVTIKGKLKSPKVSIDAKALLKEQVKQKLEKRLKNKIPIGAKSLLNLF